MRLYLSSFRMGDRFDRLMDLAGPKARVAVISNAVDFIPAEARAVYLRQVFNPIEHFQAHGLEAHDLDLRDHFGRPDTLEAALAEVDLVWAVGGNTFLLRRAMRQSGLDALLERRLAQDSLVYAGWSAGAVIAGATLRGLEFMDEPEVVAEGYAPEPIWDALGLLPYVIVPHFASDHVEAAAGARCVEAPAAGGVPYRTLRDGQAIVVDGDREELV